MKTPDDAEKNKHDVKHNKMAGEKQHGFIRKKFSDVKSSPVAQF